MQRTFIYTCMHKYAAHLLVRFLFAFRDTQLKLPLVKHDAHALFHVCVYVYMYLCAYFCMCIYPCVCARLESHDAHTLSRLRLYMCANNVRICMHHVRICMHKQCTYMYAHNNVQQFLVLICVCLYMYVYVYVHVYICVCTQRK